MKKPSLVIPKTAILNNTVFNVNDGKAYKINVTTGKDFDSYIEITSGLQNGDEIIDDLTEDIKEAIKVKINK